MASKYQWEAKILDGFAPSVSYVVRICTANLAKIVEKYGNSIPEPPDGFGEDGPAFDGCSRPG